jgi:hypothetical protein
MPVRTYSFAGVEKGKVKKETAELVLEAPPFGM